VRDTSREKENRIFTRYFSRLEPQRIGMHKIARVVEQHDDHHEAPQQIDRIDP
jgi:hypothetical protein